MKEIALLRKRRADLLMKFDSLEESDGDSTIVDDHHSVRAAATAPHPRLLAVRPPRV